MKKISNVLMIMWLVLSAALDFYIIFYLQMPMVCYLIVGTQVLGVLVVVGGYQSSQKEITWLLTELSRLIDQMTGLERQEVFSPLEENMTSKLQVQVTRLSDILRAQSARNLVAKQDLETLVSDIAHQLKTPLTNVGLYTQLLENQELDKDVYHNFYEGLRTEVDKLHFLLDALIQMSRLEGGVIKICEEEAVLQETCLMAIKAVYMKAKQKEIEIYVDGTEDIVVWHDPKWTAQAIGNLLDNAIKYSKPYTKIKVTTTPYEFFVRLDVQDEGIGIPEAEYTKIFKRFYRGKVDAKIDGIGIGLYLSRKIIDMQKGYIKVKSKEGEGSTFSIMLPLNKEKVPRLR